MIVKPRLTNADNLGMPRDIDQFTNSDIELFVCIVRMRANSAPDFRILLGQPENLGKLPNTSSDGYNEPNIIAPRPFKHAVYVSRETVIIQVTMTIDDEHQAGLSSPAT
jgi:hypothetical protein